MKGATAEMTENVLEVLYFNPRTREGCDGVSAEDINVSYDISIHAPVKGATSILPLLQE